MIYVIFLFGEFYFFLMYIIIMGIFDIFNLFKSFLNILYSFYYIVINCNVNWVFKLREIFESCYLILF